MNGVGKRRTAWRAAFSAWYVGGVAVLALAATQDPNHIRQVLLVVAIAFSLPTFVLALPFFYVVVGTTWNVTGADHGSWVWVQIVAYVAAFVVIAMCNVAVWRKLARWWNARALRRASRAPQSSTPPPMSSSGGARLHS